MDIIYEINAAKGDSVPIYRKKSKKSAKLILQNTLMRLYLKQINSFNKVIVRGIRKN